jgi:hypothetical protein
MAGEWVRSSTCSSNSCIEVRRVYAGPDYPRYLELRLDGNEEGRILDDSDFREFIEGVKRGDFDSLL